MSKYEMSVYEVSEYEVSKYEMSYIHNCDTIYVCTLYYLKRTFVDSLKNGVGHFSMGGNQQIV